MSKPEFQVKKCFNISKIGIIRLMIRKNWWKPPKREWGCLWTFLTVHLAFKALVFSDLLENDLTSSKIHENSVTIKHIIWLHYEKSKTFLLTFDMFLNFHRTVKDKFKKYPNLLQPEFGVKKCLNKSK